MSLYALEFTHFQDKLGGSTGLRQLGVESERAVDPDVRRIYGNVIDGTVQHLSGAVHYILQAVRVQLCLDRLLFVLDGSQILV